jgi:hypothetical protein
VKSIVAVVVVLISLVAAEVALLAPDSVEVPGFTISSEEGFI